MAKKRERLEVIYDILTAVQNSGNEIKPTRLLFASNLSHQMFKEYTKELLEKELLELKETKKSKKVYCLKDKGFEFLSEYKVIQNFIENFGL